MEKFSLLKQLDESAKIACIECDEVSSKTAWKNNGGTCPKCKVSTQGVAEAITYQSYDLPVDGKEISVLIPIRECEAFETTVGEYEKINKKELKLILRTHRGIRGSTEL